MDYLSENGKRIYEAIEKHCRAKLKMMAIDSYELAMLANSFDCYARAAEKCKVSFSNTHDQIRAEYTVMKTEYANILKHSGKFGMNPADRDRIFKGLNKEKKRNPVDGLD